MTGMSELPSRVRCLVYYTAYFQILLALSRWSEQTSGHFFDNLFCEVLRDVIFVFSVLGESRPLASHVSVQSWFLLPLLRWPYGFSSVCVQMLVVTPAPLFLKLPNLVLDLFSLYSLQALSFHHYSVQGLEGCVHEEYGQAGSVFVQL